MVRREEKSLLCLTPGLKLRLLEGGRAEKRSEHNKRDKKTKRALKKIRAFNPTAANTPSVLLKSVGTEA